VLLYQIVHALTDSFFPILADFDDRIDELEDQDVPIRKPTSCIQEICPDEAPARSACAMAVTQRPERDMFARLVQRHLDAAGHDARGRAATSAISTTT